MESQEKLKEKELINEKYLLSLCVEIGTNSVNGFLLNKGKYMKSLKRIRREINLGFKENENHTITLLEDFKFTKNYIIPLINQYHDSDSNLLTELLKLLILVTMKSDDKFFAEELIEQDLSKEKRKVKREEQLKYIKRQILQNHVLISSCSILNEALSSGSGSASKKEIEIFLWFLKNVTSIEADIDVEEGIISNFEADGIFDILLFVLEVTVISENVQNAYLLLDIFHNVYKSWTPLSTISSSSINSSVSLLNQNKRVTTSFEQVNWADMSKKRLRTSSKYDVNGNTLIEVKKSHGMKSSYATSYAPKFISREKVNSLKYKTVRKKKKKLKVHPFETQLKNMIKCLVRLSGSTLKTLSIFSHKILVEFDRSLIVKFFDILKADFKRNYSSKVDKEKEKSQFTWLITLLCNSIEFMRTELNESVKSFSDKFKFRLWTCGFILKEIQNNFTSKRYTFLKQSLVAFKCLLNQLKGKENEEKQAQDLLSETEIIAREKEQERIEKIENSLFYELEEFQVIFDLLKQDYISLEDKQVLNESVLLVSTVLKKIEELAEKGNLSKSKRVNRQNTSEDQDEEQAKKAAESEKKIEVKPWIRKLCSNKSIENLVSTLSDHQEQQQDENRSIYFESVLYLLMKVYDNNKASLWYYPYFITFATIKSTEFIINEFFEHYKKFDENKVLLLELLMSRNKIENKFMLSGYRDEEIKVSVDISTKIMKKTSKKKNKKKESMEEIEDELSSSSSEDEQDRNKKENQVIDSESEQEFML